MRIKTGFWAWSTLSAMLLSVAVISGCNEESSTPSTTPAPAPAPAGGAVKKDTGTTPPPPTTPKEAEKK